MKKLLFLLAFVPMLSFAEDRMDSYVNNEYVVSFTTYAASASSVVFHIYNSTTNTKTLYVGPITIAADHAVPFVLYSSCPVSGKSFTGTTLQMTPQSAVLDVVVSSVAAGPAGRSNTAIPSVATVTVCSASTLIGNGGNQLWGGVMVASTTITNGQNNENVYAVKPGATIYLFKTGIAADKSTITFRWKEDYR
jgi:hypothetical protein